MSKVLRFLVCVLMQISWCFSILSSAKLRPQWLHSIKSSRALGIKRDRAGPFPAAAAALGFAFLAGGLLDGLLNLAFAGLLGLLAVLALGNFLAVAGVELAATGVFLAVVGVEAAIPVLVLLPAAALRELKVKGSRLIAAGDGSLLRIRDRPSDFALLVGAGDSSATRLLRLPMAGEWLVNFGRLIGVAILLFSLLM